MKEKKKMKKRTKIILISIAAVIVAFAVVVYINIAPMLKMMGGSDVVYDNIQEIPVYSTDGDMDPTGFTPSDDAGTYNLIVERMLNNDSTMMKKATIQAGNGTIYKIVCDEGGMGEQQQQAPNPLSYMIAGSSMNLLNQVTATAIEMGIEIDDVTVEQSIGYRQPDLMTDHAFGFADTVTTSIIIQSSESEEKIEELKDIACASWEAGEGLANKTVINPYLLVNGKHFEDNYSVPETALHTAETDLVVKEADSNPAPEIIEAREDVKMSILGSMDLDFEMIAVATYAGTDENPYKSTARVRCNMGGYSAWDISCDDASLYGGVSSMPTSLHYFTAGTGLCLMTQMTGATGAVDLDYNDYRVEQQITYDDNETVDVSTYVLVSSNDTDDKNDKFFNLSLQMCFAGEALKNPTDMEETLYLNGSEIE